MQLHLFNFDSELEAADKLRKLQALFSASELDQKVMFDKMIRIELETLEKLSNSKWYNDIYVHWENGGTFGYNILKRRNTKFVKKIVKSGLYIKEKYLHQQFRLFP